jgi:hypothetical protein
MIGVKEQSEMVTLTRAAHMIHSWRVFHVGSAGIRHLAPCDAKGQILSEHTLTDNCPCGPLLTEQYSLVRVHHAKMQHV